MVGRIKAALDARRDQTTMMMMARIHRPAKGYSEQETMDLEGQLATAGCDAFYLTGFSLDQQQKAAYYHIDSIGVGAMYMALKELKATGRLTEAATMSLPRGHQQQGDSSTGLARPGQEIWVIE